MAECMRCGFCCHGFLAFVPKTEDVDLTDEYLNSLGLDVYDYIKQNTEVMGEKCKWLQQDNYIGNGSKKNDVAVCGVYDRRSNQCRNYCSNEWCNYGLMVWKKHMDNGNVIPNDIFEIIKKHPMYKYVFKNNE